LIDKILKWFIRVWIGIVIFFNILAILGFLVTHETFYEGWLMVKEAYNPFNISNIIGEIVLLWPAFLAIVLRELIGRKIT